MGEVQAGRPDLLRWAIICTALAGLAAVLYVIGAASFKPKDEPGLEAFARGELAKLEVPASPRPAPNVAFTDAKGRSLSVADFKGQVVVVNLWATWCAPCVEEMPTLARLQGAYAVQPLAVVPISVDREGDADLAASFLARYPPLKLYRDPAFAFAFGLDPKAKGFPTTIVYDRKGRERARLAGDADWASPEARALIERLLKER